MIRTRRRQRPDAFSIVNLLTHLVCALGCFGTLGCLCSPAAGEVIKPLPRRESVRTRTQLPPVPAPGLTIHVSPEGDDRAAGTSDEPFASLERARDEVRRIRRDRSSPQGSICVQVHGGEYRVTETLHLTAEDSAPEDDATRYCAAPGEAVRFRGGVRLKGWQKLTDSDAYPLLPRDSIGKLWYFDLQDAGIVNPLPLQLGGFASGNGFRTHPAHELFFDGKALQPARGPNEGFLRIADVVVKDGTKGYDRQGSKSGIFRYEGDLPSKWKDEPDLLLYGYWFWDWADSYERVAEIDPQKRVITLAKPWHNYGFSIGAPFYAFHALSELDTPGEWYMDRANGRILMYPPSDPTKAEVEISTFPSEMLRLENVANVRFEGFTWELGSADAIRLQGGSRCVFAGCTIRQFAGNAMEIGGGEQHTVMSCNLGSMGRGGIVMSGGNRKTLTPGGHLIENCEIHNLSRIDHTYTPAIVLNGAGNRIRHCRLHDILSSAIRLGGNDHTIEYNEIYNVVMESDDQGGLDMWGNPTYRGNVIRYNYWHHIGHWQGVGDEPKCGQCAIRLDDAICGTWVHGNLFERCSAGKVGFGGVQIHGGKDNRIENNLFVDCAAMVSCTPWSEKRWRESVSSALDDKRIDRGLYLHEYPELASLQEDANRNYIRNNRALRCLELYRRAPENLDVQHNVELPDCEFNCQPDNPLFHQPGFETIPIAEIGVYQDTRRDLAQAILGDRELPAVLDKARKLLGTGLTAGGGYDEVWIRDLNTFLELALEVNEADVLRDSLLTFFQFQGADGNIVDGYIPQAQANVGYQYRRSPLAPGLLAHKNTVETDQESSLVQAIAKFVRVTGDRSILSEKIDGVLVTDRLANALRYVLTQRFDPTHKLAWGATTMDWGDVQPEHKWGVELDATSHRAIDIYDNAMLLIALNDYVSLLEDQKASSDWISIRDDLKQSIRTHLWNAEQRKFIPHLYLEGSPFPADFDEAAVFYHGGTAVAIEAGLLTKAEIKASLEQMRTNVRAAGAASIGLTVYPTYPAGSFKNPSMKPYSYQNGGDWCWFGGRMIRELIRNGLVEDAYQELRPMVSRVVKHEGFPRMVVP